MIDNDQPKTWEDRWGKTPAIIFTELLEKMGIRYAYVFSQPGGEYLPNGLETVSKAILTPDGKLWEYTLGWDPEKPNPDGEKGYYTLTEPRNVTEEAQIGFESLPIYIRARKELNLPLTEEQERILKEAEEKGM